MPRFKRTMLVGEDAFSTLKLECGAMWHDTFSLVIDGREIKERFISFSIRGGIEEYTGIEWESYDDAPVLIKNTGKDQQ